jgi:hypothetical protein
MTKNQKRIYQIAEEVGGKVRESYSGRNMFGKSCMGIVTDNPLDCIALAGRDGLKGAKIDNMGKSNIVYWEKIAAIDE